MRLASFLEEEGNLSLKVVQARKAGFCFGVKRAIELAEQESAHGPVCSWGPLIHNAQVVKSLAAKGVSVINSLEEVKPGQKLLIRSHGAPPQVFAESERLGIPLVDATCPFVKKAQMRAWEASKAGFVVIVGDPQHPEVHGLLGWAGNDAVVVSSLSEAKQTANYPLLSVIAQTTLSQGKFEEIVEELRMHTDQLVVHDTICFATHERQEAAAELAGLSDIMIVVGSQTSSNTRQLADICEKETRTYLIDTSSELQKIWFHECRTAGLTAGASTPDWIIEEVYNKMSEEFKTQEVAPETESVTETSLDADSAFLDNKAEEGKEAESVTGANRQTDVSPQDSPAELADDDFSRTMEGYTGSLPTLFKGALVSGAVVKISSDEIFIDINWKSEGVIPLSELAFTKVARADDVVKLGDMVTAVVLRVENEEGHPILSKRRAAEIEAREFLAKAFASKEEIRARVMECVKGGLLVDLGMRGFVPASQIQPGFVEDLSVFVGQELRLRVLEYDEAKKKLVLSQKVILNEEMEEKRTRILADLRVGDVIEGVVQRLTKFGAFVDIGGIDALLHISDMAFSRIQHPSEVVAINSTVQVKILSVDQASGKVSLGLKQLKSNPWDSVAEKYPVGTTVEGTVVRIAPFGAFVQMEDGVDALIHISQLTPHRIPKVEDAVSVEQVVSAIVIECKPEEKRLSLSMREFLLQQDAEDWNGLEGLQEEGLQEEVSEAQEDVQLDVLEEVCEEWTGDADATDEPDKEEAPDKV